MTGSLSYTERNRLSYPSSLPHTQDLGSRVLRNVKNENEKTLRRYVPFDRVDGLLNSRVSPLGRARYLSVIVEGPTLTPTELGRSDRLDSPFTSVYRFESSVTGWLGILTLSTIYQKKKLLSDNFSEQCMCQSKTIDYVCARLVRPTPSRETRQATTEEFPSLIKTR